jgi:hypothetical protein
MSAGSGTPHVGWTPEKRIIGRLGKSGDSGYVLLHELLRTDFSLADEPARKSYEAGFCFKHDHAFPPNFALDRFSALRIELEGLEEWFRLKAIDLGEEIHRGKAQPLSQHALGRFISKIGFCPVCVWAQYPSQVAKLTNIFAFRCA